MNLQHATDNLRNIFGFQDFRPGQEQVVQALLAGRPALAVFPTGGGKSLCYQLPALQLDGLTLVVSPLIALMKDQVDQLQSLGVAAARLDSTLTADQARDIYDRAASGSLKLLYVAPERLGNEGFRARLRRTRVAMLAIDEAHCISEWGHNFRPDYLKIAAFASEVGVRRVLCLTATATPSVSRDIRAAFDIDPADHVQTGFHRPNLTLRVLPCTAQDRLPTLVQRLQDQGGGSSIVYVTLQKTAELVASALSDQGLHAVAYHAGLQNERRATIQDDFMAGRVPIVVATIAFGMGIDKADIRAVYHYNLPKSLEGYSQEIGRAGRDGQPSRCELLACADDQAVLDNFSYGDTPTNAALRSMLDELAAGGEQFAVSRYHLSRDHDMRPLVVATVLTYLELSGDLVATGPFYAGYKVGFPQGQAAVHSRLDGERGEFLRAILSAGRMGRSWLSLEPDAVSEQIGQPRERIVAALNWLEQQGLVTLKVASLRHGYRAPRPLQVDRLTGELVERFQQREQADIARTAGVLAFAQDAGCLTRRLVGYFGEELGQDCGHCGPCLGDPTAPVPRSVPPELTASDRELVQSVASESHPALVHPRQLTRFLCGLRSPATSGRKGLQRDRRFGSLEHLPFLSVLDEARSAQSGSAYSPIAST